MHVWTEFQSTLPQYCENLCLYSLPQDHRDMHNRANVTRNMQLQLFLSMSCLQTNWLLQGRLITHQPFERGWKDTASWLALTAEQGGPSVCSFLCNGARHSTQAGWNVAPGAVIVRALKLVHK